MEPRFARFDEGLFYTLKPGRFTFSNREFSVGFDVNPLGVRDDDLSLRAPEIVVLGDSYAMGWGVEQHEAFASVLEVQTGHTVLNAGVSSYGTPRELRMLDRIDTSRLRTLVIQYCVNDAGENLSFERHGNTLVVDGPAKYDEVVSGYQNAKRYFFGRHALKRLWMSLSRQPVADGGGSPARQAKLFLNTLRHGSSKDLKQVTIVVFDVGLNNAFVTALDTLKREPAYPPHIRAMTVLDLSTQLTRSDYFNLDDHLNAGGHRIVAREIMKVLPD